MTVRVLNSDGSVSSVPCVCWHPEYEQKDAEGSRLYPAGLWVRKADLIRHYEFINGRRKAFGAPERSLDSVIDSIECGEARLEIYDDSFGKEPWRHNGTLVKTVGYGKSARWWNEEA